MAKNAKTEVLMLMANYEERLENSINAIKEMEDGEDKQYHIGAVDNLRNAIRDLNGLYTILRSE